MKKLVAILVILTFAKMGVSYADTNQPLTIRNFFLGTSPSADANLNQVLALLVGPEGKPGAAGVAGRDGFIGMNGQDGRDGIDGAPGPIGPQGIQGLVGLQGAQGPAGVAGATGHTGPAGVLSVSTTSDAANTITASLASQALSISYANLLTRLATFVTTSSLTSCTIADATAYTVA
jgi:hypothetical protein